MNTCTDRGIGASFCTGWGATADRSGATCLGKIRKKISLGEGLGREHRKHTEK